MTYVEVVNRRSLVLDRIVQSDHLVFLMFDTLAQSSLFHFHQALFRCILGLELSLCMYG